MCIIFLCYHNWVTKRDAFLVIAFNVLIRTIKVAIIAASNNKANVREHSDNKQNWDE